eukprot:261004-Hanusia_phi.AAC.4
MRRTRTEEVERSSLQQRMRCKFDKKTIGVEAPSFVYTVTLGLKADCALVGRAQGPLPCRHAPSSTSPPLSLASPALGLKGGRRVPRISLLHRVERCLVRSSSSAAACL